ncbi:MAG: helix-turn-helix transcriptional regulator [Candidatus Hodarchaeales archaeon]
MNENIVKKIKKARLERGLTQNNLAKLLDRTSASISDLERGKVQVSASDLYKIAKYLSKPIEYFYGESVGEVYIDDLVALFRLLDSEKRSEQIKIINSMLKMQINLSGIDIDSDSSSDNTEFTKTVQETYNHLIIFLTGLRQLYDKGIDSKNKLEEILGIGNNNLEDFD